ncbi:hypothetical protein GCK72_009417 [Caenorhabditis remanei]|uniref:G-protein coupled receptors family 1 profile domain-containing protein n=1 Tax=Caenorhabditis remanei TaxID=31234 RepID=A0A6A5H3S5_CAERE|nr:hypothetical protein GCK72_009417 [Caenorhabditis remanei]KAF1761163.1 hypothetical protein GCK72_009417 [Caenorhabditis remanei]
MNQELLIQLGERACKNAENLTLPAELNGIFFCAPSYKEGLATQVFVAIAFVLLMATAIIGNSVVMWIIYKHKVMHYGFNYFLFNMAFADLLIALFNVGTSWTYNLYYDWWYGDLCTLTSFFGIAPTTVSVCSMMALSWDRCQAVVNPLQKRPLSRKRSVIAILIIWVVSTVTALPFAIAASVNSFFTYDVVTSTVSKTHVCSAPVNTFFEKVLFGIQYALPIIILGSTFTRIAVAFRATNEATDSSLKNNHTRAKSKAVKMLFLMVVAFVVCWLPYHIYHAFALEEFFDATHGKYAYLLIYWIAMSSCAYNPIIYCFANERFRIGFRYVFRWIPVIDCKKEQYEYSQLFPDKMRSMAISLQKGRVNSSCLDKKVKENSSQDMVHCVMHPEKNTKKYSKVHLLSCHER